MVPSEPARPASVLLDDAIRSMAEVGTVTYEATSRAKNDVTLGDHLVLTRPLHREDWYVHDMQALADNPRAVVGCEVRSGIYITNRASSSMGKVLVTIIPDEVLDAIAGITKTTR